MYPSRQEGKIQNTASFVYFVPIANGSAYQVSLIHGSARAGQCFFFQNNISVSEFYGCKGDHIIDNNMGGRDGI